MDKTRALQPCLIFRLFNIIRFDFCFRCVSYVWFDNFFFAVRFIIRCSCVCRRRYSFICLIYCSSPLFLLLLFFVLFSVHFFVISFFLLLIHLKLIFCPKFPLYEQYNKLLYTFIVRSSCFFSFFLDANFKFSRRCSACIENIDRNAYRIRFWRYGRNFDLTLHFNAFFIRELFFIHLFIILIECYEWKRSN